MRHVEAQEACTCQNEFRKELICKYATINFQDEK